MNIATAKSLPLNAHGCIAAIIPCDREIRIGSLAIEISILHRQNQLRVELGEMRNGHLVRDMRYIGGGELKSFTLNGYRFDYIKAVAVRSGTAVIFNLYPVH